MKGILINQNVEYGVFNKYDNNYYQFIMNNGELMAFEEVPELAVKKFDLKSNACQGKRFEITYSEYSEDEDESFIRYKIQKIEMS